MRNEEIRRQNYSLVLNPYSLPFFLSNSRAEMPPHIWRGIAWDGMQSILRQPSQTWESTCSERGDFQSTILPLPLQSEWFAADVSVPLLLLLPPFQILSPRTNPSQKLLSFHFSSSALVLKFTIFAISPPCIHCEFIDQLRTTRSWVV